MAVVLYQIARGTPMQRIARYLIQLSLLLFCSIPLPAYSEELWSQNSSNPKFKFDKNPIARSIVNRKTLARLRERVIVYLAFRPDQPQVFPVPTPSQEKFNRSTTYKFQLPPDWRKQWDTTYRYPFIPEWNPDWENKLQNFEKGLRHELESMIQSIKFNDDDDNYAHVVILPKSGPMIKEVLLWVYTCNDWYPYPARYPNDKGILPLAPPNSFKGTIFR
jgi:hypothetical protein